MTTSKTGMTFQRAIKISIRLMRDEIQKLSFDANMHDRYKAAYPLAVKSSKTRADYQEAVRIFELYLQDGAKKDQDQGGAEKS